MKWFHAIGICGKATAGVALMFKKMGWFVTGSDSQFFPPASEFIKKNNIPYVEGYNYKHLTKEFWFHESSFSREINETYKINDLPSVPDLCLIVESATSKNKEFLFAKNKGIEVYPFAQIFNKYLIKENSIVIAGSAGKTTTTALAVSTLISMNLDPSYMIGAEVIGMAESLKNTQSNWSVVEGDEFFSRELSTGAKFLQYKPKYLVLTNIGWEHQDVYPKQSDYLEEFEKLVRTTVDGFIIAHNEPNINKVLKDAKVPVFKYGYKDSGSDYTIERSGKSLIFKSKDGSFCKLDKYNLIGDYNYLNYLAVFALLDQLSKLGKIQNYLNFFEEVISSFKGVKKRLEFLKRSDDLVIIDDFGIAPLRAKNSLSTIKNHFPDFQIVAVFEPNSGSRVLDRDLLTSMYTDVFESSDLVVVPTLSENEALVSGEDLSNLFVEIGFNSVYIPTSQLEDFIIDLVKKRNKTKILIVIFSSYRLTQLGLNLSKKL